VVVVYTCAIIRDTFEQNAPPRRTIGVLMARITETWGRLPWLGLDQLARERDANLVCYIGRELGTPRAFEARANVLYELVSPETVDGLVVWTSALANFVGRDGMRAFVDRFGALPIVSGDGELPGAPSVVVGEYEGMREAVEHLITAHDRRRIAFLAGPPQHEGFNERRRAYEEALAARPDRRRAQDGAADPGHLPAA
jgi:DNA-binding LacI/PurR family transcriptional regulator